MKYLLSIVISTVVLSSCTTIYFEHPQPKGNASLKGFPKSFIGTYLIEDGKQVDTLTIEANRFIYPETFKKDFLVASLDSMTTIRIEDGLLYDDAVPISEGIPYTETNDSIHYNITIKLSKYLSDSLIIKQFGKGIVLNEKEAHSNYWNSYLIENLSDGSLQLFAVGNFKTEDSENQKDKYDGELKDFFSITSFTKVSDNTYSIDPDEKTFQQLFDKEFFKKAAVYQKIK